MNRRTAVKNILLNGVYCSALPGMYFNKKDCPFIERLLPAPVNGGFAMEDYWVWCGSVIKGANGKYHMFASRWSKQLGFVPHWVTSSEVVRAVSNTPEGPYQFAEVVLPPRSSQYWDGMMTHNPTIHRYQNTYLLFYTGTTYEGGMPTGENKEQWGKGKIAEARANQRIGLATAPSPEGPWTRMDAPILQPRPGAWDGLMTTNPAPCVRKDGSILLVYKSTRNQTDLLRMGVAGANHFSEPFKRLSQEPIFNFDQTGDHIEDGYVWWQNEKYNLLMKDMKGGLSGEKHAGVIATSKDGIKWNLEQQVKAYSRKVRWNNGETTRQGQLERPQLLIQNGKPTHLFFATGDGSGGYDKMSKTWNMVIPLKSKC